jgi:hypothetical protein
VSAVVSLASFNKECCTVFDEQQTRGDVAQGEQKPSADWFNKAFIPANPYKAPIPQRDAVHGTT